MYKKYLFVLLLLYIPQFKLLSQINLVPNPGFETGSGTSNCTYAPPSHATADEFDADIDYWKSARIVQQLCVMDCVPSADWMDVSTCPYPYPNNAVGKLVFIVAEDNYHEGVRVELNQCLEKGATYRLSMDLGLNSNNQTPGRVKAHLTSFGPNWQSNLSSNNKQNDVFDITLPLGGDGNWHSYSEDIVVNKEDLCNLIIVAETGWNFVDNFELILLRSPCCPEYMVYENRNDLPALTHVDDYIIGNNLTIELGQDVTFKAGNYILTSNIITHGTYSAIIEECNSSTKPSGEPITVVLQPNVFTPDGNGVNDQFCIVVDGASEYEIMVKSPSGSDVYHAGTNFTGNTVCVWDGTCNLGLFCNGQIMNDGGYPYVLTFRNCTESTTVVGTLQLSTATNKTENEDSSGVHQQPLNNLEEPNDSISQINSVVQNSSISIVPNPNNGSFTLSLLSNNRLPSNIFVYDALGKIVYQTSSVANPTLNIDISGQASGIYLVRVQNGEEQFLKKMVKR